MNSNDPLPLLRMELARVFKNQRVIKAFEKIFDLIPPEFINQQTQLDALELIASAAESRSAEAVAAIERLADAIESLSPRQEVVEIDDIVPRGAIGSLGEQQADAVEITAGSVTATLTDSSTNLIASSATLSDAAAANIATLTNAPAAGNPTKWLTIDDNGIPRSIPSW